MKTRNVRQYAIFITQGLYERPDIHEWIVKQSIKNHDISLLNWSAEVGHNQLTGDNIYALVWYGYEDK